MTCPGSGCYVAGSTPTGANIYVGSNAGLLVSTNNGGTFSLASVGGISAPQVMVSFAGAKQGGTTRFLCVTENAGDVYPGRSYRRELRQLPWAFIRRDWGQANWMLRTNGIQSGDEPAMVAMSLTDVSTAHTSEAAGAVRILILEKTTNGTATWQRTLFPTNNQNVFTGWAGNGGDRDRAGRRGALGTGGGAQTHSEQG